MTVIFSLYNNVEYGISNDVIIIMTVIDKEKYGSIGKGERLKEVHLNCTCGWKKVVKGDEKYFAYYEKAISNGGVFMCQNKKCEKLIRPVPKRHPIL